jgi:hypothetical protein
MDINEVRCATKGISISLAFADNEADLHTGCTSISES